MKLQRFLFPRVDYPSFTFDSAGVLTLKRGFSSAKINTPFHLDLISSGSALKVERTRPPVSKLQCRLCSGFSSDVAFYTVGTLPALPLAPRLVRAGVSWVTLEWARPDGSSNEEQLKYTLEMQEDNSVSAVNTGIKLSLW